MPGKRIRIIDARTGKFEKTPKGADKFVVEGSANFIKYLDKYELVGDTLRPKAMGLPIPPPVQAAPNDNFLNLPPPLVPKKDIPVLPPPSMEEIMANLPPPILPERFLILDPIMPNIAEWELPPPLPVDDMPSVEMINSMNFKGFKRETYNVKNVGSIEGLYDAIVSTRNVRKDATAVLRFIDPMSQPRFVTVRPEKLVDVDTFADYIDTLAKGDMPGSDQLSDGTALDPSYLSLITFGVTGYGGCPPFYFAKNDEKEYVDDGKCLMRAVYSQLSEEDRTRLDESIFAVTKPPARSTNSAETMRKALGKIGYGLIVYSDWPASIGCDGEEATSRIMGGSKLTRLSNSAQEMILGKISLDGGLHVLGKFGEDKDRCVRIVYNDGHFIPYKGVVEWVHYLDRLMNVHVDCGGGLVKKVEKRIVGRRCALSGMPYGKSRSKIVLTILRRDMMRTTVDC